MAQQALVIGGTGPTGPYIVEGLLQRGYEVCLLHRGVHEVPEIFSRVEHIHTDPHFLPTLQVALNGRHFDVTVATYGRLKVVAEALVGKTDRLISIGAILAYESAGHLAVDNLLGLPVAVPESWPVVTNPPNDPAAKIAAAEAAVLDHHRLGHYTATHFRYPYVYGPRQLVPKEWSVIRRILDGRSFMLLPDNGLFLCSHGFVENLAHAVLLSIDKPLVSAGKVYNAADDCTYSVRQWAEAIRNVMSSTIELISVPGNLVPNIAAIQQFAGSYHRVFSTEALKSDLGYADKVPFLQAVNETVTWLLGNPPAKGGDLEAALGDQFDYTAENFIVERYLPFLEELAQGGQNFEVGGMKYHPYPHPKVISTSGDHRNR